MKFIKERKPIAEHSFGGFQVKIYYCEKKPSKCYATVNTESGIWHTKVGVGNDGYVYLLKSAEIEDWPSVEAWVYCNYTVSTFIGSEKKFAEDVVKAINNYTKRLEKVAEKAAANITEKDETIADAEMRDVIDYSKMSKKERKERKRQMKEELKKVLSDEK